MLIIQNLTHSYGEQSVLQDLSLDVHPGEIVCILGPSGCGKTTLLRLIAGLEQAHSGEIAIHGRSILNVPVHQRRFGLMFQEFALFPHMDVKQNILFGLRMNRFSQSEQDRILAKMIDLVGLTGLESRHIDELSGGQRQRVALARSLAPAPCLLMLDEPLGALDAALKGQLAIELRQIIKHTGTASLYVTHDQNEAFSIADRIAVMRDGKIEQMADPKTLYLRPATRFVASFLELENILPASTTIDGRLETPLGCFAVNCDVSHVTHILVHPDMIRVQMFAPSSSAPHHVLKGRIDSSVYIGDHFRVWLTLEGMRETRLVAKVSVLSQVPAAGSSVWITYDPDDIVCLEDRD